MVAHEKGGYRPGPAKPRSWLGAIAWRVAGSRRRKQKRRREDYDAIALETARSRGQDPATATLIADQLLRVQQALDTLEDDHRAVFVLYEIEGESCVSIAKAMGVPEGTIYSRLHHARQRFSKAYGRLEHRPLRGPMAGVA